MQWQGHNALVAARELVSFRIGSLAEYEPLSGFHYRPMRYVGTTQVFVAEALGETPVGIASGAGRRGGVVAGLVMCRPEAYGRARDRFLGFRYSKLSRGERQRVVDSEFRCISRVTVHPTFRGNGIAVGLIRMALESHEKRFVETLAMFAAWNECFDRAGMRKVAVEPPPHDDRLREALVSHEFYAGGSLDWYRVAVAMQLPVTPLGSFLMRELRAWWRSEGGASRERGTPALMERVLEKAKRQLFQRPVYYVWDGLEDE